MRGGDGRFVMVWDEDVARCFEEGIRTPKPGIWNVAGQGAVQPAAIYSPWFEVSPFWNAGSVDAQDLANTASYLKHCRRYKVPEKEIWKRVCHAIFSSTEFQYLR